MHSKRWSCGSSRFQHRFDWVGVCWTSRNVSEMITDILTSSFFSFSSLKIHENCEMQFLQYISWTEKGCWHVIFCSAEMGRSCVVAMENCDRSSECLHPHRLYSCLFKTLLQGIDNHYKKKESQESLYYKLHPQKNDTTPLRQTHLPVLVPSLLTTASREEPIGWQKERPHWDKHPFQFLCPLLTT